jgi:hypothetical protein
MPEPEEYPPGWMWIAGFVFAAAFSIGVVFAAGYGLYRLVTAIF